MRILFIHHSTGGNLIRQGNVRELLKIKAPALEFWDHGYNLYPHVPLRLIRPVANMLTFHTGLTNEKGEMTGRDFTMKLGNDDPSDFMRIFMSSPETDTTLENILSFDVILFKNCFPASKIDSEERLTRYKENYTSMRKVFMRYPKKLFVPFTPPPFRKEMTKATYARRAREFSRWLANGFSQGAKNIAVFDFFGLLADYDGYLRREFCSRIPFDSHPNRRANEEIAPVFVDFLIKHIAV